MQHYCGNVNYTEIHKKRGIPKTRKVDLGAEWNMASRCQRRINRMENNEKTIIGRWKMEKHVILRQKLVKILPMITWKTIYIYLMNSWPRTSRCLCKMLKASAGSL